MPVRKPPTTIAAAATTAPRSQSRRVSLRRRGGAVSSASLRISAALTSVGGTAAGLRRGGGHRIVHGRHERLTSSTHGTHPIDCPGACSRHDPGFGRAPGGIVRAGRPPGFPEDVLQDVGGVAAVTDDAKDQRIDHGGVAVVEPGERVAVAGSHSPDEVLPHCGHGPLQYQTLRRRTRSTPVIYYEPAPPVGLVPREKPAG